MIQQQVDAFIASHQGMFPAAMMMQVYDMLSNAPEEKNISLQCIDFKNPTTALLLSIFLGYLGIDRFYLGDIMQGSRKAYHRRRLRRMDCHRLVPDNGCGTQQELPASEPGPFILNR